MDFSLREAERRLVASAQPACNCPEAMYRVHQQSWWYAPWERCEYIEEHAAAADI